LGATALAGALCLDPSAGHAQAVPSATPFDPIINFGQTLKNNGIYFDAAYASDLNAVVSGGQKTGVMTIGHFSMAGVFDLETILGIPSASIHIGFDQRVGLSVNEIAGSPAGLIQSDAGPFVFTLGFLYWEQGFWNDRLDITLGRTNPTFDFAFSDISCTFVGQICAQPTSWYGNNLNGAYPIQEWGGRVNFQVTPEVYVRAGVYQHQFNPPFPYADHGFAWWPSTPGAFIPMEIGYQTSYKTAQYPAKYNAGGYIDTAISNPNTAIGGRTARGAWWAQAQQAVWRPDRNTNQSLWVFGGALTYTGHSNQWGQYYVGLFTQGPLSSRPRDTAGFIASMYTNNSANNPAYKKDYEFELNYGLSIIPGITFKPFADLIVNPTNGGTTVTPPVRYSNAWVLGFQVAIDLGQAFEWPTFVPH
jgi:carbohydrate-selective porin OprB